MFSVVQKTIVCNISAVTRLTVLSINKPDNHANFSVTPVNSAFSPNRSSGLDYIRTRHLNKGQAFTLEERQYLGIEGLIPPDYKTQEQQIEICTLAIERFADPLNKYLFLSELHERNERLYYSFLASDVEKYLPIVYTPTVGLACQKFGYTYRKPKGMFVTIRNKGRVFQLLKNWPISDVYAIVVSDGERILGLGDLGAFGMGIPIGKLALYTALAGVKPHRCLPILLDVGCNNESLLVDPMYIGLRQKRKAGKEYDDFIEEFMQACVRRFGRHILIQFEDFARDNAVNLLQKYRNDYCAFNDDIQGTASIIVAGIIAASKAVNKKISQNVFLFLGAGAAGVGIADLLVMIMMEEGISKKECEDKIFLFDVDGLLANKRPGGVPNHAKHFGKDLAPSKDFAAAVVSLKPTCLIGVSTVGGAFTPQILKQMAKNAERPLIFALSNPTSKAECTAQDAYDNTEGRCIFASGSPFPPVKYGGREYHTGQGNNSYVFPGVGLGVICANISVISDALFLTAAKVVANNVTSEDIKLGRVFPSLKKIRNVSLQIALAVAEKGYQTNVAGLNPKPKDLEQYIKNEIYKLKYPSLIPEIIKYPEQEYKMKLNRKK
ncbi:unnamed protein product [Arctia plantaginis]|uniref:Malic enzyme n=1 Tax=Arctia plantaginis TaxID=874455 RepID=A0A8S0ZUN8_ARCPL|nr:unnamed protein product [Arctia plantaginis]